MMKLNQHQHESFLNLTVEGEEVGNRVCQILADMDAVKSVQKMKATDYSYAWTSEHRMNSDMSIVRQAMSSVEFAEDAIIELTEVTSRRKMVNTSEHLELALAAQQLGTRLYRNMWELALSDSDRKVMHQLLRRIASLTVWEDIPAPLSGRSYERVTNAMTGVVAYSHAYGVTFMHYKHGMSSSGWSVLRNTLEEAVAMARSGLSAAVEMLSPAV